MRKPKQPKHFIKIPGYPGGNTALDKFIKDNLRYPKEALEKKLEGTVAVDFDFNHKGKVTKATIKSPLGHGCDEEAIRIVKLLRFNNSKNRGVKVTFHKSINIHFRLEQVKTTAPRDAERRFQSGAEESQSAGAFTYNFKPTPPKEGEKPESTGGYTITIKK